MKNKTNNIILLLILVLLFMFFESLHSFVKYYISIDSEIKYNDIKSRILPPLLGSFFSGIVALLIFYLTKLKDDFSKNRQSKMYLQIIDEEINSNLTSIDKLKEIVSDTDATDLANSITNNPVIQEQFKLLSTNLSAEIMDKFVVQLNKDDYILASKKCKNFHSLIQSLQMLNSTNGETENKVLLIKRIKEIFKSFDKAENDPGKSRIDLLPTEIQFLKISIGFIIIYSVINILIAKFVG